MLGPGNILIVGPRSGKVPQNKGWLDGIAEGMLPGDHALGVEVLAVGRAPSELVSKPSSRDSKLLTLAGLCRNLPGLLKEPNTREQRMSGRTPGRNRSRALASHTFINLKTSARSSRPKELASPLRTMASAFRGR